MCVNGTGLNAQGLPLCCMQLNGMQDRVHHLEINEYKTSTKNIYEFQNLESLCVANLMAPEAAGEVVLSDLAQLTRLTRLCLAFKKSVHADLSSSTTIKVDCCLVTKPIPVQS